MSNPDRRFDNSDDSESDRPRRQPLYIRMYFRQYLTDLVRLIGYQGISLEEARPKFESLAKTYGRETIVDALDEITRVDASLVTPIIRLTEQAAKLARGLLGNCPTAGVSTQPPASTSTNETASMTNVPPPSDAKGSEKPVARKPRGKRTCTTKNKKPSATRRQPKRER